VRGRRSRLWVTITRLAIPYWGEVPLGGLGYVLTFLWIVGLTNAYNFMDGLEDWPRGRRHRGGLPVRNRTSAKERLCIHELVRAACGHCGFPAFQFPAAKIFLGDVGSAFLGFTFSTLAVIGASLDLGHLSFYIVPMLLFHFIFDTVFTFSRRLLRGEKVYLPTALISISS